MTCYYALCRLTGALLGSLFPRGPLSPLQDPVMPSQEPPTDQQIQEVDPAPDDSDDNKGEGWGLGEGWVLCIYELMRCLCFGKDNV